MVSVDGKKGALDGWEDFTQVLNTRFGPSGFEDRAGFLTKLRQSTTIQEYQEQFKGLANRTKGLSESFMVSCFVAELKEEVWLGVQMFRPSSLSAATNLASLQEEKN